MELRPGVFMRSVSGTIVSEVSLCSTVSLVAVFRVDVTHSSVYSRLTLFSGTLLERFSAEFMKGGSPSPGKMNEIHVLSLSDPQSLATAWVPPVNGCDAQTASGEWPSICKRIVYIAKGAGGVRYVQCKLEYCVWEQVA